MSESILFATGTVVRVETLDGPDLPPLSGKIIVHDTAGLQVRFDNGERLEADMPVHVEVQDDAGLYSFSTYVAGHDRYDKAAHNLAPPDEIELTQRRAFTRVPDAMTVSVILRDEGRLRTLSTVTLDVSVGGLSLRSPIPLDGPLTLVLTIPDAERPLPVRLRLDGDVRRCVEDEGGYRVAVAFAELAPDEEQTLSQYLFRRMREIRKAKVSRR